MPKTGHELWPPTYQLHPTHLLYILRRWHSGVRFTAEDTESQIHKGTLPKVIQ